jgi:Ser/Thr protein kinase RdoA (MazF antagonist)
MQTAHTILSGEAIAQALIEWREELGTVQQCELLRRGFNEVYDVRAEKGHFVARLSALRARGPANVKYELSLLAHVQANGGNVAVGVGETVQVALPEGLRELAVFRHIQGCGPDAPHEFDPTGEELARIHQASQGYAGPVSRYTLDLRHLVERPLAWLMAAPTMDEGLRDDFEALAKEVTRAVGGGEGLTQVACHGDCHGGNNFIQTAEDGRLRAAFFDFDDAGPGWLAYDLAVLLWGHLPRRVASEIDSEVAAKYQAFLAGYRRMATLPSADLEAVPAFLVARNIWLLGEFASRRHHWGSQAIPTGYLRKQVPVMRSWLQLKPLV